MSTRGAIALAGSLAQKPWHGGHTWVFLQYLLGFRRLGWDVLFLDELDASRCVDEAGNLCPPEESWNLRSFVAVMDRFGLTDAFSLRDNRGEHLAGLPRPTVLERVARSAVFINVMGFLQDEEVLGRAQRRVFLDIDPGFGQMWKALDRADVFRGHDNFVTIGENIGQSDCAIPTCGLKWITTPQPVVLDCWPAAQSNGEWFTSVASWRGAYGPVEYEGKTYGLRVHEFRQFAPLPRLSGRPFQLALDIHPSELKDLALLNEGGWSLIEPRTAAGDPWSYQKYIQGSKAEFMVAKNMYVRANSGWLSDRSLCYLASGKPVLTQDTGLARLYPTREGLLTYDTLEGALAAVEEVCRDYKRHTRAARTLAEDCFDSDKVLSRLLGMLGVS